MFHGLTAPEHWQTASERLAAYLICVSVSFLAALLFGFHGGLQAPKNNLADRRISAVPTEAEPRLVASYGKLPLSFEVNQGQTDPQVKFLSRGQGYALFLTGDEALLALRKSSVVSGQSSAGTRQNPSVAPTFRSARAGLKSGATRSVGKPTTENGPRTTSSILRMKLVGANTKAAVTGGEELPGKSNYFIGNDPKKWRTNVPTYAKVRYKSVYPGVDLVYYGNQGGQLEYDFVVAPGADPSQIKLSFAGAKRMRVDAASGDLVLKVGDDDVRFHKPTVYQPAVAAVHALECGSLLPLCAPQLAAGFSGGRDAGAIDAAPEASFRRGKRQQAAALQSGLRPQIARLDGTFVVASDNEVAFRVAGYDPKRPLVIDPVLSYSTYLGGSSYDYGGGIAVDSAGNAYVAGSTGSTDFPTLNPLQPSYGGGDYDAFVAKLNPAGSALVYSTYLGGSGSDQGVGIAVDSSGNAYVTGLTQSTDFPTLNPLQAKCGNCSPDYGTAFVAKLNASGSALLYSTYLGGSSYGVGGAIAVDSSGNAYVTGQTSSKDFPTVNPFQASLKGTVNAFVSKLNSTGSALVYSTYLGGSTNEWGAGIAVDSDGNAYVTGYTQSTDFPLSTRSRPPAAVVPPSPTPL